MLSFCKKAIKLSLSYGDNDLRKKKQVAIKIATNNYLQSKNKVILKTNNINNIIS